MTVGSRGQPRGRKTFCFFIIDFDKNEASSQIQCGVLCVACAAAEYTYYTVSATTTSWIQIQCIITKCNVQRLTNNKK